MQMRIGLLCAAIMLSTNASAAKGELAQRLSSGWEIVKKVERIEVRPGLPPYREIPRRVLVTLYEIAKANRLLKCRLEYDSQRDHFEESCGK